MPNRCWAPGCKSNYYPKDPYIPVFKSPEDPELRQAWINELHREHGNPPKVFYVCAMHFHERDIENTIRVNDGVEIKYTKRERPILVKGAIPSILPGCPSYLSSTKTSRPSRFSHESKEEDLFITARNLSLETQDIETKKFKVDCFSDLKEKITSCYPEPWLLWLSQDNMLNFIYPSKSEGIIRVEAALTIDSTMTARGYFQSKEISLRINCITDVRQIETLLTELVEAISCFSTKISQPKNMIAEAITNIQNAVSHLEDHSQEEFDDKSNDIHLLPSLQFTLCQLRNLCVQKNRRRYNTITQIIALKAHLISSTCYNFLQSLECLALPHFNTIQKLYFSFGLDDNFTTYLKQATSNFTPQEKNVILQMDEIHVKSDLTYKAGKIVGGSLDPNDPTKTVFSIMVSSLFRKWSTIVRLLPLGSSSAQKLFPTIQSVISDVEQCNLSVQVISTDAYPLNVNLFKLFSSDHTLQPVVQHPVDSTRNLFLILDFVHVLKSIRNNWLNVKNHDRILKYPSFEDFQQVNIASFEDIRLLYREVQYKCAKLAPRLIAKACWPTSFERQNVSLALRIFCESTSSAIKVQNLSRTQEFKTHTSEFIDTINQLWKIFNVNRPNKNIRLNDDISEQFYYNDFRFGFLAKIVDWLDKWKSLPGKDGKLSAQTFTSIKHSCLALPRIVNYLTKERGFTYFLTYFLQTDALEHHFGLYRMMSGANYHISYCQILESERRLKVSTILNIFSNRQSNDLTLSDFISSFSATTDDTTTDTSSDIDIYLNVIFGLSDISLDTATLQYLAFIGGYCVQQLWKHTSICSECICA